MLLIMLPVAHVADECMKALTVLCCRRVPMWRLRHGASWQERMRQLWCWGQDDLHGCTLSWTSCASLAVSCHSC